MRIEVSSLDKEGGATKPYSSLKTEASYGSTFLYVPLSLFEIYKRFVQVIYYY